MCVIWINNAPEYGVDGDADVQFGTDLCDLSHSFVFPWNTTAHDVHMTRQPNVVIMKHST